MGQVIRFPSSSYPGHAVTPAADPAPGADRVCAGHTLRSALLAAQGADMALGPLLSLGWPMHRIRGLGAASLAALMGAQRRADRTAPPPLRDIAVPRHAEPALRSRVPM